MTTAAASNNTLRPVKQPEMFGACKTKAPYLFFAGRKKSKLPRYC